MIKFGNDIVTVGGDWLKYVEPVPPTPVVDELLISTDTVTTAATKSGGGIIWYENSSPITYSGNNRYVVHKMTLSNAHQVVIYDGWSRDMEEGQVEQNIVWGSDGNMMVGVANIEYIGYGNYRVKGLSSGGSPRYAYTDWTRAYGADMFNQRNPVIFRFIVDRDTNKVNIYCTSTGAYASNERLVYDANMVVAGATSMLSSPTSIAPYSTTAAGSSDLTTLYVDAKYEMHACSSFDVAIAC